MILKRTVTKKIKVGDFFEKNDIPEIEDYFVDLPYELKVKTPYGYHKVPQVCRTIKQKSTRLYFSNNKTLECGWEHKLKVNGTWKQIKDIDIENDVIHTETGYTKIVKINEGKDKILYDLSVDKVHCFYSNGILSHNTWALCQLGFNAALHGKNVLHITLELDSQYTARRYDTILTGKPFSVLEEDSSILTDKLKEVKGDVDVKWFPTRSLTTLGLEGFLEKVIQLKKVDLIVLDYADLLSGGKKATGNSYDDMGSIYEELRGLSGKLQIPIWTATQTNRDSLGSDVIGAQGIADSYKKVMTADFIMSIIRKDIDKLNNRARVHIIKNRFGPDGMTFSATMDTHHGKFHIYNEHVDNQKVENEQEKLERKQLKEKFNSFSSKNKVSSDFG